MPLYHYGLISDTHGVIHASIHDHFQGVEAILHAGDVGGQEILNELRLIAPVHAVTGNTDWPSVELPNQRMVDLQFGKAGIAHGHMHATNLRDRHRQLAEEFQNAGARVVVTGHSHRRHLEEAGGIWVLNPGAACRPRFRDESSVCLMTWDSDRDLLQFEFRKLDWK